MKWSSNQSKQLPVLQTPTVALRSPFSNFQPTIISTVPSRTIVQKFVERANERTHRKRKLEETTLQMDRAKDLVNKFREILAKSRLSSGDSCIYYGDSRICCKRSKTQLQYDKACEVQISKHRLGISKLSTFERKKLARSLQLQKAMIADEDGDRAIHIAVAQEDVLLVKKICSLMKKSGASLDITNHLRQTPLHLAIIVGNSEIVRILVESGASMDVKDRKGSNAVQLAVKFYQQDTFSFIVSKCGSSCLLDSVDYDGLTAMHYAVSERNSAAVDGLCLAGADVNAVDGKSGRTPLLHAVISGYTDMVHLLLRHGADGEKVDYAGWSPIELALQSGNRTMMRLFEIVDSSSAKTVFSTNSSRSSSTDFPEVSEDDGIEKEVSTNERTSGTTKCDIRKEKKLSK